MTELREITRQAANLIGQVLHDKWRLDALLGVGGMASVFVGTHRNGKRAAIKLLHRSTAEGSIAKERFLREGYVANKVGHPGVVSVLDDDTTEDGRVFLVMELLEGETLKARWMRARKRLPLDETLRFTHALLDVLAAAHEKGIIHRDIKPENIFITHDGTLKVLDFGIARLRENTDSSEATRSNATLGTPAFMAPEQARSRWDWVDARTDIWAVGATMFTLLSGQLVHDAATATEVLVAAATMRARPVRSAAPEVPDVVAAIIDRALAYEQSERWSTARDMQAAIAAVMNAGATALAAPPPPSQPVVREKTQILSVWTPPTNAQPPMTTEVFTSAPPVSQPVLTNPTVPSAFAVGMPASAGISSPSAESSSASLVTGMSTGQTIGQTGATPARNGPSGLVLAAAVLGVLLVGVLVGVLIVQSSSVTSAPSVAAPAPAPVPVPSAVVNVPVVIPAPEPTETATAAVVASATSLPPTNAPAPKVSRPAPAPAPTAKTKSKNPLDRF